jgi:dipeptidyl aminopeptidase/acylaminoacyl peptidase
MRLATLILATPLAFGSALGAQQQKRVITFDDFAAVKNVSDPQPSPDGKSILYAVRTTDVAANRRTTKTFVIPSAGGTPQPFPSADASVTEARWSPDGKRIAYVAGDQLWVSDPNGANAKQLTQLNGGATGVVWSPIGDRIAFTSAVYPECANDACNAAKAKAASESKVKAHIADQLMFRHWNAWDEGTRSHLFVVALDGSAPRDLVPGAKYDVPPPPFGGSEAYGWSPDGREIAYTAKDQGRAEAWNTDLNVYVVPVTGGASTVITATNKGADQNPVYSPDGRFVVYASQARAGFESDRWRLMLYNRADKTAHELLPTWDRNADAYMWSPDMSAIYIQTTELGRDKIFRIPIERGHGNSIRATAPKLFVGGRNNLAFSLSRDGRTAVWLRDAADAPAEVYAADVTAMTPATPRVVTHENDRLISQLALNPVEEFTFTGAGGARTHGFVVKPPNWQAEKKYPGILLIHGGPQGAWLDTWHGRWNYQMFAATAGGSALIIINPRGSTGYGQRFVDEVSKDWGGKVYTDLMNGLDAALAKYPWIDRNALGAAGGSFGGYMANWINGHTNRFKALVSHAGPFNLENMAVATEELWFTDWEYGGPFWNPKAMSSQYRVYSPHLYVKNFKTPTLVTGGELDYRVPYTEALSMFTALQRMNVPSRLVMFPDEGHWIAKPQNQKLWWGEVQGWLAKWMEPRPKA